MYSGLRGSVRLADTPSAAMGVYVPPAPACSVLRTTEAEPLLVGGGEGEPSWLSVPAALAREAHRHAASITAAATAHCPLIGRTTPVVGQRSPDSYLRHPQTIGRLEPGRYAKRQGRRPCWVGCMRTRM